MTGETKLNVMNLSLFGIQGKNGLVSSGLIELNLGSHGPLYTIGQGGTDVSLEKVSSAIRGLEIYKHNREIRNAGEDKQISLAMKTLVSSEQEQAEQLYTKILNGNISFTSATESGYNGQTIMNEDGTKTIEIDRTGLSSFDLGVLLAHEANRDGVVRDNSTQERETADSVINHMDLASAIQDAYGSSYLNEANNMEAAYYKMYQKRLASREDLEQYALENYDSSADYWKLMDSGEVVWDGKKDLTNEAGETVRVDKTGSYSKSLLNWLGKKQSVALLKQRGIDTSNMSDAEIASSLWNHQVSNGTALHSVKQQGKIQGLMYRRLFPAVKV